MLVQVVVVEVCASLDFHKEREVLMGAQSLIT